MNLSTLVQRVYSATDRNPNTTSYENEVKGFLNDALQALCEIEKWLFLEKRHTMTVYPDYTTGTVTVVNGSREVTGSNAPAVVWGSHMDGHWFIGPDGKTYTIAWVDTSVAPDKLYLTTEYEGTGAVGGSYTIRFFAYTMPADCVEPGPITSRDDDRGRIAYIDNETDATTYFDRDDTGDPEFYLPAGEWQTRTLDLEPTATVSAGGSLKASTVYRYVITVVYEGVEGPPSKEVTGTTTAANKTIKIENLDNLQIGGATSGYRKRIYRKDGTGAFYFLVEKADSAVDHTDAGAVTPDIERPLLEYGTTTKVWFYPRPDEKADIEVWYKRRPRRMQKDQDVPDIPPPFHEILWRMATRDVLQKYNQPTTTQERLINEKLDEMRRRWLSRNDRRYQMGSSWTTVGDIQSWRFRNGTASIT